MIQINLTLSVSLDAGDLDALDKLAAIGRGINLFAETTGATQSHTEPTPAVDLRADSALSANPSPPATAQNGPRRHEKPARPPKIPALHRTPVLPPVFPATTNGNGNDHAGEPGDAPADANDPPHPSNRLPFAEFDRLVRSEMKRLSMDGRLPGHKLWNSERNPQLPTMAAVLLRYQANGLAGLAEALGLEPPLSVQKREEPTL